MYVCLRNILKLKKNEFKLKLSNCFHFHILMSVYLTISNRFFFIKNSRVVTKNKLILLTA